MLVFNTLNLCRICLKLIFFERQGAPSSPTIFNLMMKYIIKRLRYYGHGEQIGQLRVLGAAFADDSWLAANNLIVNS